LGSLLLLKTIFIQWLSRSKKYEAERLLKMFSDRRGNTDGLKILVNKMTVTSLIMLKLTDVMWA